jgi:hypothetical protein
VHSYVVAFWVAAAIFAGAAVVCALVFRDGLLESEASEVVAVPA